MNRRIAKKLRKEMLSWNSTSKVRHKHSSFKKAWQIELKCMLNGEKWATPSR